MVSYAIEVKNLTKIYPNVKAVDNISFTLAEGEIFGFLGPNGAGKTTTIRILMTLGIPTNGEIQICGMDARKNPTKVRQIMGYVPQEVSVDGDLTGYENLLIYAKLCYVNPHDRKQRIQDALDYMGLSDRANDLAKHYSGGMMRRLEIAQALVNQPRVLFLDEPSIGLDPVARRQVWKYVKEINQKLGTTIFITTHDMTEADELCHRIAIIDAGKIVTTGTPLALKETIGGDFITIGFTEPFPSETVIFSLVFPLELGKIEMHMENHTLHLHIKNGASKMLEIIQTIKQAGMMIGTMTVNQPTLDDVFLKYTHTRLTDGQSAKDSRITRRSFKRHAS